MQNRKGGVQVHVYAPPGRVPYMELAHLLRCCSRCNQFDDYTAPVNTRSRPFTRDMTCTFATKSIYSEISRQGGSGALSDFQVDKLLVTLRKFLFPVCLDRMLCPFPDGGDSVEVGIVHV